MATREVAARLEEVLGEPFGGELRRLSSGASRQTFSFELVAGAASPSLLGGGDPVYAGGDWAGYGD